MSDISIALSQSKSTISSNISVASPTAFLLFETPLESEVVFSTSLGRGITIGSAIMSKKNSMSSTFELTNNIAMSIKSNKNSISTTMSQ